MKIWPKLSGYEFVGDRFGLSLFFFFNCALQFSEVHEINFRDS